MPLKEERAFRLASDVRFRVIDEEGVLVRQDEAEVLVVSDVAARILQLIEAGSNFADMVDVLIEEFEVELATLEADVHAFLTELEEAGIIENVER